MEERFLDSGSETLPGILCGHITKALQNGAQACLPSLPLKANRPWISHQTFCLIESRQRACSSRSMILENIFFPRTFLSPIHAVPVRSPSPKLKAGWPRGVGKVHDTRPAGLAGGPSPPRREAAGDRAVWPVALFGEEIAEGWDRAIDVGCAMQKSRLERGSKGTDTAKARMPDHRCAQALAQLARRCAGADRARLRARSRTNSTASELQRPATSMASTTNRHRWARMSSG